MIFFSYFNASHFPVKFSAFNFSSPDTTRIGFRVSLDLFEDFSNQKILSLSLIHSRSLSHTLTHTDTRTHSLTLTPSKIFLCLCLFLKSGLSWKGSPGLQFFSFFVKRGHGKLASVAFCQMAKGPRAWSLGNSVAGHTTCADLGSNFSSWCQARCPCHQVKSLWVSNPWTPSSQAVSRPCR